MKIRILNNTAEFRSQNLVGFFVFIEKRSQYNFHTDFATVGTSLSVILKENL